MTSFLYQSQSHPIEAGLQPNVFSLSIKVLVPPIVPEMGH